jgi:hypothetical protein
MQDGTTMVHSSATPFNSDHSRKEVVLPTAYMRSERGTATEIESQVMREGRIIKRKVHAEMYP